MLPSWIIYILFGILGLIVGSFLNVVVIRKISEISIGGRSYCPHCHKQLSWYELIPVVSFLIQCARCRSCHARISWQYPIVELLTGVVFGISGWYLIGFFDVNRILLSVIGSLSFLVTIGAGIAIAVYDFKTRLVPLPWFLTLIASSILFLFIHMALVTGISWIAIMPHLLGILIAVPFLLLWLVSHGAWIGFADIEIIAWIGLWLGVMLGTSSILLAFYAGALVGIIIIIFTLVQGRSYHSVRKIPIAFAPFLLSAWFITTLTGWSIFSLFIRLFM
jgi:prepilin signal peptidase PulO-like enzyme (type II secretory pathway)